MLVTHNTVRNAHCGFGIGSENVPGTEKVIVCNNTFIRSSNAYILFKTPAGRGGFTKHLYIFDNTIKDAARVIGFDTHYEDAGVGGSATADDDRSKHLPDLHDIHIWNLTAEATNGFQREAILIDGLTEKTPVYDIAIDSCSFIGFKDALNFKNAKNIAFTNSTFDKGSVSIDNSCHALSFGGTSIAGSQVNFTEDMNEYTKKIVWNFTKRPAAQLPADGKPASVSLSGVKTEKGVATLSASGNFHWWEKKALATGKNKITVSQYKNSQGFFDIVLQKKATLVFTLRGSGNSDEEQHFAVLTTEAAS